METNKDVSTMSLKELELHETMLINERRRLIYVWGKVKPGNKERYEQIQHELLQIEEAKARNYEAY